jgi:hypothetical protein
MKKAPAQMQLLYCRLAKDMPAIQRIPRLLQLIDISSVTKTLFEVLST